MTSSKYFVSLPVKSMGEIAVEDVVNLFHKWIKDQEPSQLLLDVADYSHVPDGPGVMLIGYHEIITFRLNAVSPVVTVTQKSKIEGNETEILSQVLAKAMGYINDFAKAFEGKLELNSDNFFIGLNDRLPTRKEALATVSKAIEGLNLDWQSQDEENFDSKALPKLEIKAKTPRTLSALQAAVSTGQ